MIILIGAGAIALAIVAYPFVAKDVARLSNTSYFNQNQIEEGKRTAREGQSLVKAIHAFKASRGSWPDTLESTIPDFHPRGTALGRWNYYLKDPSFGLGAVGSHSFLLYYEPEYGWLMAEDPDTRPIRLGEEP